MDRTGLEAARQANDVTMAQEILQRAFRTDVRPIVAEARIRAGGAWKPLEAFRQLGVREQLIRDRGSKTISTGL